MRESFRDPINKQYLNKALMQKTDYLHSNYFVHFFNQILLRLGICLF